MEPFQFGLDGQLFGAFHPGGRSERGVLIAGPLLGEQARAANILRGLAGSAARDGLDVLRFDYAGLGNSGGNEADRTVERWLHDIEEAANELMSLSGCRVVTVVAARFSANLACSILHRPEVERLLLWDPVLCGSEWLADLAEWGQALADRLWQALANDEGEYSGLRVGPQFSSDLLGRSAPTDLPVASAAIISRDYGHEAFLRGLVAEVEELPLDCHWRSNTSSVIASGLLVERLCAGLT